LVIASNRVGSSLNANEGGLATALLAALDRRDVGWFGWSGEIVDEPPGPTRLQRDGNLVQALVDLERSRLTFFRVPYDHGLAAQKIRSAGLPERVARRLERRLGRGGGRRHGVLGFWRAAAVPGGRAQRQGLLLQHRRSVGQGPRPDFHRPRPASCGDELVPFLDHASSVEEEMGAVRNWSTTCASSPALVASPRCPSWKM